MNKIDIILSSFFFGMVACIASCLVIYMLFSQFTLFSLAIGIGIGLLTMIFTYERLKITKITNDFQDLYKNYPYGVRQYAVNNGYLKSISDDPEEINYSHKVAILDYNVNINQIKQIQENFFKLQLKFNVLEKNAPHFVHRWLLSNKVKKPLNLEQLERICSEKEIYDRKLKEEENKLKEEERKRKEEERKRKEEERKREEEERKRKEEEKKRKEEEKKRKEEEKKRKEEEKKRKEEEKKRKEEEKKREEEEKKREEEEKKREEEEKKREEEEKKREEEEGNLIQAVSDWDTLPGGLHYSYLFYYYPTTCDFNATEEEWSNRWLVWNFKNTPGKTTREQHNDALNIAIPMLKKKLISTFGAVRLKYLTLVCIPASSQAKTEARYKEFSNWICNETSMINAYDHISVIKPRTEKHLGGTGMDTSQLSFDKDFFRDKYVLLFDDVITRGNSMIKFKNKMESLGAKVVGGLALGKTKHERPDHTIYSPYSPIETGTIDDDLPF